MAGTIGLGELARRAAGAADPPAIPPRAAKALPALAVAGYRRGFAEQRSPDGTPWPPPKWRPGGQALLDTGHLRASGTAAVVGDTLVLSTTAPGAALLHFGGEVVAKGKALAIPVSRESRRVGSPLRFPGPPLVYLPDRKGDPSKRGKLAQITFRGRGKQSRAVVTVHYILRRRVVVPSRPFVGFSAETIGAATELVAAEHARFLAQSIAGGD
jgi:phage gpG-like protein